MSNGRRRSVFHVSRPSGSCRRVVPKADAKETRITPRIEVHRLLDQLVEAEGAVGARGEVHDGPTFFNGDPRTGVDRHERGHALRMVQRELEAVHAAHRHPDDRDSVEPARVQKACEVACMALWRIVEIVGPLRVAMPPLIESETAKLVAQSEADEIPGARSLSAAVKKEDGLAMASPVQAMDAVPVHNRVSMCGGDELRDEEPRKLGASSMMRFELDRRGRAGEGCESCGAHGVSGTFFGVVRR